MEDATVSATTDTAVAEASLSETLSEVEWWRWLLIVVLVILSGCYSGLNLGVLGLNVNDLEMIA